MLFRNLIKKNPFHPTFILFFLWFLINNNLLSFFLFIFVVFSHEFGHYIVAKKLGYKLDTFIITPFGACLNYKERAFENRDEVLIALAGPIVNLSVSLILVSLWWIVPQCYGYTYEIVNQSLLLGLFNLLPCYPLDGGRVFCGLLSKNLERKKAVNIITYLNYFFSALLFSLFVFSCFNDFNPSLALSAIFLILGNIDFKKEGRYLPISIYKKTSKNFSKPLFIYVNEKASLSQLIKHIEINKFTIFIVNLHDEKTKMIDENTLKNYTFKYPLSTTLGEILNKVRDK